MNRSHVRAHKCCALLVVVGLAACAYFDAFVHTQQVALPAASLDSVSTIAVCSREFGTDTDQANKATDALCGKATDSEMSILTFSVLPNSTAGASTFTFGAFPPPPADNNGRTFNRNRPCGTVNVGEDCRVIANDPMRVTISSSPMAVAYQTAAISKNAFPANYFDLASIAKWGEDDEEDDDDFSESKLLNPEGERYACINGFEIAKKTDGGQSIADFKKSPTKFGGMHETNGGHYQWDGGCNSPRSDPNSLQCKDNDCTKTINARAWCLQRRQGSEDSSDSTIGSFVTLSGPCMDAGSNSKGDPYYPHAVLRADYWDHHDSIGGACVVCRADYTTNTYMAGLFGNERKCNTLMQDFRQCYVEQLSATYGIPSSNVLCTSSEFDSGLCDSSARDDQEFHICMDSPSSDADPKSCAFYLPQQECQQLLGQCTPLQGGTACWGSYNQPEDFYTPTTGSDNTAGVLQGFLGKRGKQRGAGQTPFWINAQGGSDNDASNAWNQGHLYRCGHFCGDFPQDTEFGDAGDVISDQKNVGYVKGWFGVGPLCRAFKVRRRGKVEASVQFNIGVQNTGGGTTNATLTLSSTDVGGGSSVAYDPNVAGAVAKLLGPASTTGRASKDLGGVIVVCGAEPTSDSSSVAAPGTINGVLSDTWDPRRNPWQQLQKAVDLAASGTDGTSGAAMGACKKGCAMPTAPLITAMQCFACDTASLAPREVCKALKAVCSEPANNLECRVPIDFDDDDDTPERGPATCTCTNCAKSLRGRSLSYWTNGNENVPRGVSWMWYEERDAAAFGNGCGQYGMNPFTYGKDRATGEFVCTRPGAEVPCVPGRSSDTPSVGVPPPCAVMGGMTDFYCRTSAGTDRSETLPSVCGSVSGEDGCGSSSAGRVPLPRGVPLDWSRSKPRYWYHRGRLYTEQIQGSSMRMEAALYLNNVALDADVQNVAPGRFVQASGVACVLQKGSTDGVSYVAVQNTGTFTSSYEVRFQGCGTEADESVQITASDASEQQVSIAAGAIKQLSFALSTPAGATFDTITCQYELRPSARENVVLDNAAYGCTSSVPRQNIQPGQIGLTPIDAGGAEVGPEDCFGPDFLCWLFYGPTWSVAIFWVVVGIIVVVVLIFLCQTCGINIANSRALLQAKAARKAKKDARALELKEQIELQRETRQQTEYEQTQYLPEIIERGIEAASSGSSAPDTPQTAASQ